jgi:hypothetical protein
MTVERQVTAPLHGDGALALPSARLIGESTAMTIDERLKRLTIKLKRISRDIESRRVNEEADENIRALLRIAEMRERRQSSQ